MLKTLTIENYALIDKVELNFEKGLTIVTGETGSGKSIMLDALSLLTGERADSKAMADPTKKTIVEAFFTSPAKSVKQLIIDEDIEWNNDEIIIRREISPGGRSRSFINDSPVTLNTLEKITGFLIDIHSQHKNTELLQTETQLATIDAYGKSENLLEKYKDDFNRYLTLRNKIKVKKENIEKLKSNREYIIFRLEQLDKIKPRKGELEEIEKQYDILSDADRIKELLGSSCQLLEQGETSILSLLGRMMESVKEVSSLIFDEKEAAELEDRLTNIKIELKDINETLSGYMENIDIEPAKLSKLNARMNMLYDAIKKFKVSDEDELISLYNNLKDEYNKIENIDTDLSDLESEARKLATNLKERAEELSLKREESSREFSREVKEIASVLGLKNIQFEVKLEKKKLTANGQDKIEFLCSFNKNMPLRPISKVASGGETARLMLAIKSIMAKSQNLPTLIFDEIDTGVSGEIADKMGEMMRQISKLIQVLSITHLPQVAAYGCNHFKVYKKDEGDRTKSYVKKLSEEERLNELAGMLSGTRINEAALLNAKSLIEQQKNKEKEN